MVSTYLPLGTARLECSGTIPVRSLQNIPTTLWSPRWLQLPTCLVLMSKETMGNDILMQWNRGRFQRSHFGRDYSEAANQRMHVSRRVEFTEVVSRSRRPRDPYRSARRTSRSRSYSYSA